MIARSRQFEQTALPVQVPPAPQPPTLAELQNASARPGTQLKLPFDVPAGKAPTKPEGESWSQSQGRLVPDDHPIAVHHGGTYPMMMTGVEIRNQFQALDADRHGVNTTYTRNPSYTATHTTHGGPWSNVLGKVHRGDRVPRMHAYSVSPETDDELYERKYEEAEWDGLPQSIAHEGYRMDRPISLSTGHFIGSSSGGRGDRGKYQVLGGHHRVAVMSEDFPRQLASVDWHSSIVDAKESLKGRY